MAGRSAIKYAEYIKIPTKISGRQFRIIPVKTIFLLSIRTTVIIRNNKKHPSTVHLVNPKTMEAR